MASDVMAVMAEIISRKSHRSLGDNDDLAQLGFDSQAILDVILEVEERTGLQFDATVFDFEQGIMWRLMAQAFT